MPTLLQEPPVRCGDPQKRALCIRLALRQRRYDYALRIAEDTFAKLANEEFDNLRDICRSLWALSELNSSFAYVQTVYWLMEMGEYDIAMVCCQEAHRLDQQYTPLTIVLYQFRFNR